MKKIGILTFHPYDNYGAVLQAYALQAFILNHLKEDVEVIDYCTDDQIQDNNILQLKQAKTFRSVLSTLVFKLPICFQLRKRKVRFKKFRQEYLHLSDRFSSAKSLFSKLPDKDIYITGSDQVFNPFSKYTDVYYLGFNKGKSKKVAYAPSFGISDLEKYVGEKLRGYLKDFDAISCREQSGAVFLSRLLGKEIPCVLDPVFLLSEDEWDIMLSKTKKPFHDGYNYIFVYNLNGGAHLMKFANRLSTHFRLPVVCVASELRNSIGFKMIYDCGPIEILHLIKNANYVVTDSFHGTALSHVFGDKVLSYIASQRAADRITTIMNRFNLSNCIVRDVDLFDLESLRFNDYFAEMSICIYESQSYLREAVSR